MNAALGQQLRKARERDGRPRRELAAAAGLRALKFHLQADELAAAIMAGSNE